MGLAVPTAPLILLADADQDNRDLVSQILRLQNFDTVEAFDGPGLIESATRLHPHLILTELRLHQIDGFEAASRLKADPSTGAIPIVALTGYTPANLEEKARQAGIEQVVLKPVAPDALIAVVQRVLATSQALREEHRALAAAARQLQERARETCARTEALNEDARRLLERSRLILDRKPRT